MDVIPHGLIGLLLATLEVLGIPKMDIHPLEVLDEDPLKVRLVVDAVVRRNSSHAQTCSPTQMERYWMMK